MVAFQILSFPPRRCSTLEGLRDDQRIDLKFSTFLHFFCFLEGWTWTWPVFLGSPLSRRGPCSHNRQISASLVWLMVIHGRKWTLVFSWVISNLFLVLGGGRLKHLHFYQYMLFQNVCFKMDAGWWLTQHTHAASNGHFSSAHRTNDGLQRFIPHCFPSQRRSQRSAVERHIWRSRIHLNWTARDFWGVVWWLAHITVSCFLVCGGSGENVTIGH